MSEADTIRDQVSEAYTRAVEQNSGRVRKTSCCSPPTADTGCCGSQTPKGVTAQVAGYDSDMLATLPADAVQNAFGCGNPLAFSEVQAGQTVVDLGSGAGIDLIIASRKVGAKGRVIGVDMTDAMIARAQQNLAAAGCANAEIRKGVIEALPVDTGSVDWVISNCVINLSPEKDRVFSEIARVLLPGGRFSISDIVLEEDVPAWLRQDRALYSACVAGAISERAYLQGLRDAGLIDLEVEGRLVYDAAQIRSFIKSEERPDAAEPLTDEHVGKMVSALAGKVWSVKVVGKKPALAG